MNKQVMDKRISIRLGEREHALVGSVAKDLGCSQSEVIRLAICALSDELPVLTQAVHQNSTMTESLGKCTAEVRRVGANVNQVVRTAHYAGWTEDQIPSVNTLPRMIEGLVETVEREVRRVC